MISYGKSGSSRATISADIACAAATATVRVDIVVPDGEKDLCLLEVNTVPHVKQVFEGGTGV